MLHFKFTLGAALAISVVGGSIPASWPFEHIVVFMQENRAFDHYYGTHAGIRGFNNRAVHPLKNGLPAFYQPSNILNASQYQLPFAVNATTSDAQCMPAPTMTYASDIGILSGGRLDRWNTAREMGLGPAYWTRYDLPYYYTLLDSFAVGDQYHQSSYTCTNPNRMHLFTGSNGLSVGQPPVLDNTEPDGGYGWMTAGEVLEEAGIDWKVLKMEDDFDDNAFAWFSSFKKAQPGEPLFDRGMASVPDLVTSFGQLLANDSLPQVTWIVGPESLSEHATWHPSAGSAFTSQLLAQLQAHPDVYAKTVFILNYDEGGQFNDYHLTPNAPVSDSDGLSTVTTVGEVTSAGLPIGPGFRVPLVIVSPWTRGNVVVSEVMDHTSVLKFIEARFNVTFPTLSPWRRAMMGDMLSAFDWDHPDASWPTNLPNTSAYVNQSNVECETLPPVVIPAQQSYPVQEPGVKVSRALPYVFLVSDSVALGGNLTLNITNAGPQGAAFNLLDVANLAAVTPRKYGVEGGKAIADGTLPVGPPKSAGGPSGTAPGAYFYALHGPNGFVRLFIGDTSQSAGVSAALSASLTYQPASGQVTVVMANAAPAGQDVTMTVTDNAYGMPGGPWTYDLPGGQPAGATVTAVFNVTPSGNWYDLTVSASGSKALSSSSGGARAPVPGSLFTRRFMGRMETGADTISDPAMAAGIPGYVPVPHSFRTEAEWHAAMDAAFSVGETGSRSARAVLGWDDAGIVHPPTPEQLRILPRAGAQGDHKDAMWRWDPAVMRAGEL